MVNLKNIVALSSMRQIYHCTYSINPCSSETRILWCLHSHYHGYWWPGNARTQGNSSHIPDLPPNLDPRKATKLTIVTSSAIWYEAQQQCWRITCNIRKKDMCYMCSWLCIHDKINMYTCVLNYVYMQDIYVYMQDNYVYVQDNYVYIIT